MRLHKANYLHLFMAALSLAQSDREEMDLIEPGRDPVDVLTASSDDPTTMAISDERGNVLAVGGHYESFIWFVHTTKAERLGPRGKFRMFHLLVQHLCRIKRDAVKERPHDLFHFTNVVSPGNHKHLKLLRALGAVFDERPLVHNGHEFRQFYF